MSNPFGMEGGRLRVQSTELDPQQVRAGLLFWDQLAWPTNRVLSISSGPDETFLERAGALIRPDCTPRLSDGRVGDVGDIVDRMLMLPADVFDMLEAKDPGRWTLADGTSADFAAAGRLVEAGGIALELLDAIPIPAKDVPLAEVLDFRIRRRSEYLALRVELDSLAALVAASDAPGEALEAALARVDAACGAAIRIGGEWRWPIQLASSKFSYELRPVGMVGVGLSAFGAAHQMGMPIATAAMLALGAAAATAGGSAIKVSGDFGWQGLRRRSGPYRFVAQLHREL